MSKTIGAAPVFAQDEVTPVKTVEAHQQWMARIRAEHGEEVAQRALRLLMRWLAEQVRARRQPDMVLPPLEPPSTETGS